jgi:membrane-associated phospholipid phosphatase
MSGPRRSARGRRSAVAVAALLAVGTLGRPQPVQSQEPHPASQLHWWQGLVAIGGYAILTTVDDDLQRLAQDNRSGTSNDFASVTRKMGQPEVYGTVALGVLATGLLSRNPKIRDAGVRLTWSLAMTGVITEAVKLAVGRHRPSNSGSDADDFRPFSGQTSAPSGHAAMAFSLATTLSDEIHRPWATAILYTLATGTAWSRVNDNVHWFSDVVAGAAFGFVTARFASGKLSLFGVPAPRLGERADQLTLFWQGRF